MISLNLRPDRETLRKFGFIALVAFLLLAVAAYYERLIFAFGLGDAREATAYALAGLGCACGLFSLVAPALNRPIFVGLTLISFPIGFVLSYVFLGSLFFLLIAPIAIVFKAIGRDKMDRSFTQTTTYWSDCRRVTNKERYFNQY
ncbi:MAG: hypothetical protein B7733_25570 [Myxococcales bacterium FL481]|nr:MAG: hypothetical protein B7733_25570 [Myxococcales bacterium FL481]